jgi:uncharacterized membrane protein
MAGIYVIFSNTIMPSLKELENGAFVMAKINDVILNPLFKLVFFFSAISSAYLGLFASHIDLVFRLACVVFLVGTFVVTLLKNVPLNNVLKQATLTHSRVDEVWAEYLVSWVKWNHIRSISAFLALILVSTSSFVSAVIYS